MSGNDPIWFGNRGLAAISPDQKAQLRETGSQTLIARPSVQSLFIEMRFGSQPLSTGTAFVVIGPKGPLLISNRHNFTGRHQQTGSPLSPTAGVPDNIVIRHNRHGRLGEWVQREEPLLDADSGQRWHEHPRLGQDADFVALPLSNLNDVEIHAYDPSQPGPDMHIGPADVLSVVGFPFGLSGDGGLAIWATGFVASEPLLPKSPTFYIDCRTRQGQSGSAVIAYRSGGAVAMTGGDSAIFAGPICRLLGIYSGRINSESDLGIVWKASLIAELVESLGQKR